MFALDEQPGYWVMRMVVAARLAYQPPSAIEQGDFNENAGSVVFFNHGTTQAYGFCSEGYRCLVFRGSQEAIDFIVDGAIWLVGYPARHFGFEVAWKKVRCDIERWLNDGAEPRRPLLLAGHSLGGALAVLAANYLSETYPIAGVITFGGPRVGAASFAEEYAKRTSATGLPLGKVTWRFRHASDPVAIVPPPILYRHVGVKHSFHAGFSRTPIQPLYGRGEAAGSDVASVVGNASRAVNAAFSNILVVDDWLFDAAPYAACALTLGGIGLFVFLHHWTDVITCLATLGSHAWVKVLVSAISIAALKQFTYLVPRLSTYLRWLVAIGVFAGASVLGWTTLLAAQIVACMIVILTICLRMLIPLFPDHKIKRYENALRGVDGPWSQRLNPNFDLYRTLGLDPYTQVVRTWQGKRL